MDAYPDQYDRRITADEIAEHAANKAGVSLVEGLAEITDRGGARRNEGRVAGFMETHDRREWVLSLDAEDALSWCTCPVPQHPQDRIAFALSIGFGNGSPLPQPSGQWDVYVDNHHVASVRVVKHSQLWQSGESALAFAANRIESAEPYGSITLSSVIDDESFAAFGPALVVVPTTWVQPGESATVRVVPGGNVSSRRWFQLADAPSILHQSDIYRALAVLEEKNRPRSSGHTVYFGDIHSHSGEVYRKQDHDGCGSGSREDNYTYARGAGGLDVYALSDHEWQIDPDGTSEYLELAQRHNDDGRFVCLPAYEHTSLMYGHRNIYFREPGGEVVNATEPWGKPTMDPDRSLHPQKLWEQLDELSVPYLSIPHHTSAASHPFNWRHYNPAHDRLVEIYSSWGSSAYYGDFPRGVADRYRSLSVRDALNSGCHVGIMASSDAHDGHPGNAQSPGEKHHHQFHHCGSGWVGVLAEGLTPEAVFDALYLRRCYGTTGVPIGLEFEVDGHMMGSVLHPRTDHKPVVRTRCQGTNGIREVRLIRDGRVIRSQPMHGEWGCELEWVDEDYNSDSSSYYYVRVVQVDNESAWSSPVWIG